MDKQAPKISVVVPMYNVEKYLRLCLMTILEQTFKDFELILVDDCSTDGTLEVAKSFSDSRIKILRNSKNLGRPGPVRNVGLDAAQGDYVYFCDSDDAILPHALESLYNAAESTSADVSTTLSWFYAMNPEFQSLSSDMEVGIHTVSEFAPVSTDLKTRIYQEFVQRRIWLGPVHYLYRRKFLSDNKIKFPNETAEDVFFNFDVIYATSKITKMNVPFYVYRIHQNSESHNPKKLQKNIQSLSALHNHIEKKLSPLGDPGFLRVMLMFGISQVMETHVVKQLNLDVGSVDELLEGLAPNFGQSSSFLLTFLYLYNTLTQENQTLKERMNNIDSNLIQENEHLKITLQNIGKQISEVLKV